MEKIVINRPYGGFHLGSGFVQAYDLKSPYISIERDDKDLVAWVEAHPDDNPDLHVVEIPDEATDYTINEYDGAENVIMVIDGKLVWRA